MQRGFFGVGIEGASKIKNFGNLARTAHGFGASFVFVVAPATEIKKTHADTSNSQNHMPWYSFESPEKIVLPNKCQLVGVEITNDATELPSFRHPKQAAYVLGPEAGELSPNIIKKCQFVVKIPTRFCLNVATAGAIIMYDRMISLGKFPERPIKTGKPTQKLKKHVHGKPIYVQNKPKNI